MSKSVDSLLAALTAHAPWVALTGAGVSEASGIPTYRDHGGKWLGSQPIQHDEFVSDAARRRRYWSRSALGWPRVAKALPNSTHDALAELERSGTLSGVITQNVDRLHQQAGSKQVIDLHGRLDQVRCLDCSAIEARPTVQTWLETHNRLPSAASLNIRPDGDADLPEQIISDFRIPQCSRCNGTLMPDVVFFGGTVPKPTVEACYQLIDASQGMMVLGSSLSVYSGLRFCRYAAERGKPLIILNEGQTRADDLCWHKYDTEPFSLLAECAHHLRHAAQEPLHG